MIDDLIARLEAAVEPSRDLDVAIWAAIGYPGVAGTKPTAYRLGTAEKLNGEAALTWPGDPRCGYHDLGQVRRYTGSIDAALTLVPNGMAWSVTDRRAEGYRSPRSYASVWRMNQPVGRQCPHELPIIAICIAALRARLTMETSDDDRR